MMACMATRRSWRGRLRAHCEAAWLRWLIGCAESDLRGHRAELEQLPQQIALDLRHIEKLTLELIRAERNK